LKNNRLLNYSFLLLLCFVFLLPIKFGQPASVPQNINFPLNIETLLFFSWPTSIFILLSAILLLLGLIISLAYKSEADTCQSLIPPILFVFLFVSSLCGLIYAQNYDFAYQQIFYILGLTSFVIGIYLFSFYMTEEKIDLLIWTIIVSSFLISVYGIYQYFFSIESTKETVIQLLKEKNMTISADMMNRLSQDLIYSTFSLSNSFAAHLILIFPLSIIFILEKIKKIPHKYVIFVIFSAVILYGIAISGSRGAIISLIAAVIIVAVITTKNKILIILTTLICLSGLVPYLFFNNAKGFGSFAIRFDYFRVAWDLFAKHPFIGSGWGNFSFFYPSMKTYASVESPFMPHNVLLSFASQTGILSVVILILIFIFPIITVLKTISINRNLKEKSHFEIALLISWIGWSIHSLMDINFQISGTAAVAVIIIFIMTKKTSVKNNGTIIKKKVTVFIISLILFLIAASYLIYRIPGEIQMQKLDNITNPIHLIFSEKQDNRDKNSEIIYYTDRASFFMMYSPLPYEITGNYFKKEKDWNLTIKYFSKAIKLSPRNASYYYNMALAEYNLGDKYSALKYMKTANELHPYKYSNTYKTLKNEIN